ncbi:MAG: MBL fold metallo-hydrolase [Gaiellaceae bacterium]
MRVTLLRNATLLVELAGRRILVDPMLGPVGSYPAIENTPRPRPNPLVPLPAVELEPLDAVIVTHLHRDHYDATAAETLRKELPVLTQAPSAERLRADGFSDVRPVEDELDWDGVLFARTGGRHGHGAVAEAMGPVSGFVLSAAGEPTLWIAGDTVWCDEAADALERHRPDVAVVNAGAAQFLDSEPITMDAADVARVVEAGPQVVAVHMEAINHCLLSRAELRAAVPEALCPGDGATLEL